MAHYNELEIKFKGKAAFPPFFKANEEVSIIVETYTEDTEIVAGHYSIYHNGKCKRILSAKEYKKYEMKEMVLKEGETLVKIPPTIAPKGSLVHNSHSYIKTEQVTYPIDFIPNVWEFLDKV